MAGISWDGEVKRLRRENEILRQEPDVLKRATAFFAREGSRWGSNSSIGRSRSSRSIVFARYSASARAATLAYNLGNFLRTLVLPSVIADWSPTSLRDRMIKIGAKAVRHARPIILQLAEVAIARELWAEMLATIAGLKAKAQSP